MTLRKSGPREEHPAAQGWGGRRGDLSAEGPTIVGASAAEAAGVLAAVLEKMAQRMSLFSFRGFLEPLRPRELRRGPAGAELLVLAPTSFARDWARDHYGEDLSEIASALLGVSTRVIVEHDPALYDVAPPPGSAAAGRAGGAVAQDREPAVEKVARAAPVVPFRARESTRPSRLNPKYTFESFVTGPSNRMAFAACTSVAEHPGARYSPLFLFGGTGLGKTHLLHAIGNEALTGHPQLRVVYLSAEQWVNEYITDIHERRFDDFRRRYRDGCDLLLIDDVQFLAGKNASQDEFFHTFNALYEAHKQIVVTSDRYPHEIAGLEERLKTRLQWGLVADVQPPEIETRIAILEQKAHSLGCALPKEVAEYLASHITTSIRELEGALVRLSAFAAITREPITLAQAKEQLRPVLAMRGAEVTIARVIDVVAAYYGLRSRDVVGPSRQRQVTRARQVAMYLVRHHLGRSLPEIGRAFGDRDHTTVLASVTKIHGLKDGDAGVQAVLSRLSQSLFG
jgi:chromosomal replication initiator protein